MKCISNEEIIRFVNIDTITEENMSLIMKVNAHIGHCKDCKEKVALLLKTQENMKLENEFLEHRCIEEKELVKQKQRQH